MRLLLALIVATAAFAQIPADTLVTKLAERDTPQKKFLRDHPGASEVRREPDNVHFKRADGMYTAIFGHGLNWQNAAGEMVPMAPEMWQTSAGYREDGAPVVVRIVSGRTSDDIEMYDAVTGKVVTITSPKLQRTGDWTFLVSKWALLDWTLEVTPLGWSLTSQQIAAPRGAYTYQLPLASSGADPQPDAATGDLVDGSFRLSRAVMVGADESRTPCATWTRTSKAMAFVCDDSTLPAGAFPYVIDPSAAFTDFSNTADDGYVIGDSATSYQTGVASSSSTTSTVGYTGYIYSGGYRSIEKLQRWDTSSLPDSAVITSGTFTWEGTTVNAFTNASCRVRGAWIDASIWPIDKYDFVPYASLPAPDVYDVPTTQGGVTMQSWTFYYFPMGGLEHINKTGYTAILETTTLVCNYYWADYSDTAHPISHDSIAVDYVLGGPRLIFVNQ